MNDEYYMKLAIALARKGRGYVSPNPMVGAVIVKNGRIISRVTISFSAEITPKSTR